MNPNEEQIQRDKKKQAIAAASIPMHTPGNPNSSSDSSPDSGIAAPPNVEIIGGIPHQRIENKPYPGPLSMASSGIAGTVGHLANGAFSNRAEDRMAANRAELNNETAEPRQPTKPAAVTPIAAITGGAQAAANQSAADLPSRQAGYMVENNLRQFEDKGNGIARQVGADGRTAFTNVGTADVTDPSKKIQVNGYDGAADNAFLAKANAIRKEIIDRLPSGGIAALGDGGVEAANAEKTARWRQDELLAQAKGGNRAAGEVAQESARGQNMIAAEGVRSGAQILSDANRNAVAMRGQDMTAQSEAARLAGNPVENDLKRAQAGGIAAQTDSAKMIAEIQRKAMAGDPQAAATYRALTGKGSASDRYLTVQGGEEIGPDGMTKIKRPSGVFDSQTQKFIPNEPAQAAQGKAPAVGEVRSGYKFKGGNPADPKSWENLGIASR